MDVCVSFSRNKSCGHTVCPRPVLGGPLLCTTHPSPVPILSRFEPRLSSADNDEEYREQCTILFSLPNPTGVRELKRQSQLLNVKRWWKIPICSSRFAALGSGMST